MRVSRGRDELPPAPARGSVVSVGVFDGVHLGHQAILAANARRAAELDALPTVVTFADHPKTVLLGRAPRTLTSLAHRLRLFERAGVEHTLVLPFDEALRRTSAQAFLDELLLRGLGARSFVLGFDSKFGADREGTPEWLASLGHDVRVVPKVDVARRAVSSTAIREAVELGDLAGAGDMLGRRVGLLGEVVRGAQLGRTLGFPTANLDPHHELHPPVGVYACRARLVRGAHGEPAGRTWDAVCNIGFRPTVDGTPAASPLVEVHLFDFDGDLYGRHLEVEFVARLRGEQRFPDVEALRRQIERDAALARAALAAAEAREGPATASDSGPRG
ncbi:MAG: riboflavin biosynthesis protein RibF [Planctomycetes bacterium]|nr:riboflavin biosynthesis protein RibF [Planctomycetota bacterium]